MLYAETCEEYDAAYGRIAVSLRSKPDKLQYIKGFYDHPERFAHFLSKGYLEIEEGKAANRRNLTTRALLLE
jgi:hypothetical protein